MAFIRWRGNSAELLSTVYDQGRSRQIRLICFGPVRCVDPEVRMEVAERFPRVTVDWEAVDETLAAGPPHRRAQTAAGVPNDRLEWLHIERRLRYWAALTALRPREAERLRAAAAVFGEWRRSRPYFPTAEPPSGWDDGLFTALPSSGSEGDT